MRPPSAAAASAAIWAGPPLAPTSPTERLGHHFKRRPRAPTDRDPHARLGKRLRHTAPNAAARGRDESGFAGEIEIHTMPPIRVGSLCRILTLRRERVVGFVSSWEFRC